MQIEILLKKLAKPAQRAIQNAGITTIEQLSSYSEKEISELHGIGKNAINVIRQTLNEHGIIFSSKKE
ncbi:DNA-directed RNA polymerase subunit alpha C-terminal domain-containing protein [Desulfosporosinus meridiei]|uniref:DNA-directed RNA polymerase subunit alpha C-terminal domain-containing protein n=1 Tax=Desulfosporosinus meridiei TaxID=79209 RepID=UPI0002313FAA|nr:DNA-directed RNA polymerase subunit alpha C-terminal domain-containing protein [Desulfosporosinus meridiei]